MTAKSEINKATILDFFDFLNIGKEAMVLAPHLKTIPDFVKEMGAPEISKQATVGDFAIIIDGERKFPIDSRPNTWLSKMAFDVTKDKLPPCARDIAAYHLKKAAASYSLIFPDLMPKKAHTSNVYRGEDNILEILKEDFEKKAEVQTKEIEKSFALELKGSKMFPLNTKEQVLHAKEAFDRDYKNLFYPKRHEMAQAIFNKCAELNIEIEGSNVAKYAGDNFSIFLPMRITTRQRLLTKKASDCLQSLYTNKGIWGPTKFAKVLFTFDKEAGLFKHYNMAINDAFVAVFYDPSIKKLAYKFDTKYGKVTEKMLERVAKENEKIAGIFGPEFAIEFASSPAPTFDSLKNFEKNSIIDILRTEKIL